jgi:diaminohydroxyphosphoribosylaminopyrimidine deaminase/5-amino-6-(5-phosphoribosylamino)uracil reductase
VVIACRDPFPQVDGRGVEQLINAGIEVMQGVREVEAKDLNRRFFTFHTRQRPYLILKWAESMDGAIAGPQREPVAISSEVARRLVHRWRMEEAAILVGAETVLQDNPRLTNRFHIGRQPVRIVLDGALRVPVHFNVYNDEAPTVIINRKEEREEGRLHYLKVQDTGNLDEVLDRIAGIGIQSVLVEGGAAVLRSFLKGGYADEIRRLVSTTQRIPGGYAAPDISLAAGFSLERVEEIGPDRLEFYRPKENIH